MATTAFTSASSARPNGGVPDDAIAVGIDIGSTNTKVALVACDTALHERGVRRFPTPDSADDLVDATLQAVRELVGLSPQHPVAVGIASMAETGVPFDASRRALSPLIRWNATSAGDDGFGVFDAVDHERFFCATGVPPLPKAPLAAWNRLRRRHPDLWRRIDGWMGVADLLAHALTGAFITDHTLAGRTGAYLLPHGRERMPRGFDARLLALVGLEPPQLPRVVPPGEPAGRVTATAASLTALPEGTPVYIAGHDHAVGAWGAGAREPGDATDSIGTTEALIRILGTAADRRAVHATGMSVTRTVTGGHESLLAGGSGGSLVGPLGSAAHSGDSSVAMPIGELIVLPYPTGRQTPRPDPSARLRLIDSSGRTQDPGRCTADELRRATLLGLCLQLRWTAETQSSIAGAPGARLLPRELRVIGGSPQENRDWLDLKARVLGTRLQVASVAQPVACSAALLAAVRAGRCSDAVRLPAASVTPTPADDGAVDSAYAVFRRAAADPSTPATPETRPA